MMAMDRLRKNTTTLFRLAVCVFVFNSAAAYGACCGDAVAMETEMVASASDRPPCHTPADAEVNLEPVGDCCESCVPSLLTVCQASGAQVTAAIPQAGFESRPISFCASPPVPPPD